MTRKTQRKPLIFSEGKDEKEVEYISESLGFLGANEMLLEYLPIVTGVMNSMLKGKEDEEIDLEPLLQKLPKKILTKLLTDLFEKTKCRIKGEAEYTQLDPDEFGSFTEAFEVVKKVAAYNWPDFFGKGVGTELPLPTPEKTELPEKPRETAKVISL